MAEVLVTMGVIGAVAALTLPTITSNIWTSQLRKRATIESRKFTQAIENMVAFDDIAGKGTTENFVKTLKSYLNIAKECNHEHIADCWPTTSITLYDGSRFGMDQAKESTVFNMSDYKNAKLSDENYAIITNDGTSMLLAYNTSCNKYDNKASINCIFGLMDTNGQKGPNKLGKDVVTLNIPEKYVFGDYNNISEDLSIKTNALTCTGNNECSQVDITANFNAKTNYMWDDSGQDDIQNETSGDIGAKRGFWDDSAVGNTDWGKSVWADWD